MMPETLAHDAGSPGCAARSPETAGEKEPERHPFTFLLLEGALLALFRLVRLLSRVLPPTLLIACGRALEAAVPRLLPGVRRRLEEKIAEAMPELAGSRRLKRTARKACGALLWPMFDLALFARHSERFLRELAVEGLERLERADAAGKGVILAGGHLGLNALRIAVLARLGRCYSPIYLSPDASPVSRYYVAMLLFGGRLGCDPELPVFWTGQDTVRRVREHLRRGKRVGIDFDIPGKTVAEFFGRPAAFADGIARFSLDTGAPIVPFFLRRGKGAFDNRLIFYEPITAGACADPGGEVRAIMQEVVRAGERMVREAPGQWESWFTIRALWEAAERRAAAAGD